jgi:hypothetical protein
MPRPQHVQLHPTVHAARQAQSLLQVHCRAACTLQQRHVTHMECAPAHVLMHVLTWIHGVVKQVHNS